MKIRNEDYLTNIPLEYRKHGFSKVLYVRKEVIHLKHIWTEIFVRKTIDLGGLLEKAGLSFWEYMEFMTNRLRRIHKVSRQYNIDPNVINFDEVTSFFRYLNIHRGFNNVIVLDFDGVITKHNFKELYHLCISRCKVVVCSANPNITKEFFAKRGLILPSNIYSRKGSLAKIKALLEITKKHDNVFYVDNEEKYLELAWIFGIKTYIYKNNKIKYFTRNTK